jgi:hypothetical protein
MPLFRPNVLSQQQIERLQKIRARGRRHYIIFYGVLGWGMSTFLLTTSFWEWYGQSGWHWPSRANLLRMIILGVPIWAVAGYIFGSSMWSYLIENLLHSQEQYTRAPKS